MTEQCAEVKREDFDLIEDVREGAEIAAYIILDSLWGQPFDERERERHPVVQRFISRSIERAVHMVLERNERKRATRRPVAVAEAKAGAR